MWLQSRDLRQPTGQRQTTTFLWEGFWLLQETRNGTPLTYVYADHGSYEPLARIDGIAHAQVLYFHNDETPRHHAQLERLPGAEPGFL
ncbi:MULTISPECIES: hypothetical protein [unclassified Brenneria]|uniref:hypothetical protein n=1 Tax=unclassified Brenneria TaxID=2634434 RepID=UPI0029C46360|nr:MULTISPECIES: hypothetical protein [unclassified Brenneria]MDX5631142.1 hypothetical protein [Brenneria sp. L3-3Z]MDX5698215.1 hypothetical protein [Brenneria sp. L4-2C]